jgi:hypothetical protein
LVYLSASLFPNSYIILFFLFYFLPFFVPAQTNVIYKSCPSESGTEAGAPLFPAVELCDFSGRWQCMSREISYTLDSGSVVD